MPSKHTTTQTSREANPIARTPPGETDVVGTVSLTAAFHDTDNDTDVLTDSSDTQLHPCEDPRDDVGVGVVECGLNGMQQLVGRSYVGVKFPTPRVAPSFPNVAFTFHAIDCMLEYS